MPGAVLPAYSALLMDSMATFIKTTFPVFHAWRAFGSCRAVRIRQGAGRRHQPRRRPHGAMLAVVMICAL